eukprot:5562709-Heterocapsa_arctica.AAC.1
MYVVVRKRQPLSFMSVSSKTLRMQRVLQTAVLVELDRFVDECVYVDGGTIVDGVQLLRERALDVD